MSAPKDALELFREVVESLMTPDHDLQHILRRCAFACGLCGWQEQSQWFSRELNGYGPDDDLPDYRIVPAQFKWLPRDIQLRDRVTLTAEQFIRSNPLLTDVPTTMDIFVGVDRLKTSFTIGIVEPTEDVIEEWSKNLGRNVNYSRVKFCPPASCIRVLEGIENMTFRFASEAYLQLSAPQPGLDRAPESEQSSTPPTPITTININQMYGGQIQQATIGSTQQASTFAEPKELLDALEQLLESLPGLSLDPEDQQAVEAEVGTLNSQLKNPRRREAVIRDSLGVVRTILTGASGNVAAQSFLEIASRFI